MHFRQPTPYFDYIASFRLAVNAIVSHSGIAIKVGIIKLSKPSKGIRKLQLTSLMPRQKNPIRLSPYMLSCSNQQSANPYKVKMTLTQSVVPDSILSILLTFNDSIPDSS